MARLECFGAAAMALTVLALCAGCGGAGDGGAATTNGGNDGGASAPVESKPPMEIDLGDGVTMTLVYIPPGTFMMGAPKDAKESASYDKPQHRVTLTKGFYLGRTEVTQRQWRAVMEKIPWGGRTMKYVQDVPRHAANYIAFKDAAAFVDQLNARFPEGGFRLPTEAEWEYACRAGTTTAYHFGDDPDATALGDYAWYRANAWDADEKYPHPVAQKKPNAFGLHDMHGNVREWCSDVYGDYSSEAQTDPTGRPPGAVASCVARGGSFDEAPRWLACAHRHGALSDSTRRMRHGLRIARNADR